MSDWETIWPRPAVQPVEVELVGGPRCGERRMVADPDAPVVFHQATTVQGRTEFLEPGWSDDAEVESIEHRYRRRAVDLDEPEPMPLRFDYQPPARQA